MACTLTRHVSIEHVWDALDQQHVPVLANIHKLRIAIEEKWAKIPQATISLINSMRRRCVTLHEAKGGHTRY